MSNKTFESIFNDISDYVMELPISEWNVTFLLKQYADDKSQNTGSLTPFLGGNLTQKETGYLDKVSEMFYRAFMENNFDGQKYWKVFDWATNNVGSFFTKNTGLVTYYTHASTLG